MNVLNEEEILYAVEIAVLKRQIQLLTSFLKFYSRIRKGKLFCMNLNKPVPQCNLNKTLNQFSLSLRYSRVFESP